MLEYLSPRHKKIMDTILSNIEAEDLPVLHVAFFNQFKRSNSEVAHIINSTSNKVARGIKRITNLFIDHFDPKDLAEAVGFHHDFKQIPQIAEYLIREEDIAYPLEQMMKVTIENENYASYDEIPDIVKFNFSDITNKRKIEQIIISSYKPPQEDASDSLHSNYDNTLQEINNEIHTLLAETDDEIAKLNAEIQSQ